MKRSLPSPSQIQEWLLQVTPDQYFEQFVQSPGLLVLRAKGPPGDFQGIHLAVSHSKSQELVSSLSALTADGDPVTFVSSYPSGRAWFHLYTSGVHFGSWRNLKISLCAAIQDDEIRVGFSPHAIGVTISKQGLTTLIGLLTAHNFLHSPAPFRVVREQKPLSEPHKLWLWKWVTN